jgi:2-polyprenyl-6-methoxyphenol hydroxylase-like FAD-dependent oxidoreductase
MSISIGKQAVVIGAGLAGLTAATALSDFFARVVVLDRDDLPPQAGSRSGVPQGKHLHVLLAGGQKALEELFPNFDRDLAAAGAVQLDAGRDTRVEQPGYDPFPQRDFGMSVYAMSRPLLEQVVRGRVERLGNVNISSRCRAREIIASADGTAAAGVRCDSADPGGETLKADLVVDATGGGALTMGFLKARGVTLPRETSIGIDMRYTSAVFALPEDATRGWKGVVTFPDPRLDGRGAVLFPIEGGCWMLGLAGAHGDAAPADVDGFMAFARQLRTPTVYNAIRNARIESEIVRFAFPASMRRHFERLETFPQGLLPIGDAICRFNPAFGQGMSVAAMEAAILKRLLSRLEGNEDALAHLATAFFAEIQPVLDTPWGVATADFVYPQTTGDRPRDFDASLKFQAALTSLAAREVDIHKVLLEVRHLLKPGSVWREPDLARRVQAEIGAV